MIAYHARSLHSQPFVCVWASWEVLKIMRLFYLARCDSRCVLCFKDQTQNAAVIPEPRAVISRLLRDFDVIT